MQMKMIVSAVPGSGKTTILKRLKKKIPSVKIVNEGDLILKMATKFGIKDRDELRKKLTIEQQKYIQEEAAEHIAKIKGKILIIDTHLSIKTPSGFFPGLSEAILHKIKPDVIVVLEFNPKDVIERRKSDKTRRRDYESEEDIELHQKVNREFAVSASTHVGAAVEIIEFKQKQKKPFEQVNKAAQEIIKIIRREK